MDKIRFNKVVYKLSTASAEPKNFIEVSVPPESIIQGNEPKNEPENVSNQELLRVITEMGQQMSTIIWKMNKLEQQNEFLLQEICKVTNGQIAVTPIATDAKPISESQGKDTEEVISNSLSSPSKARKRKREKKKGIQEPVWTSSEEEIDEDEYEIVGLPDWPLKSLAEMDEVIEKMKAPEYYEALKRELKMKRAQDKPLETESITFKDMIPTDLMAFYSKSGFNNRRSTDDCPFFKLLKECWAKRDNRAWNAFMNKRFTAVRSQRSKTKLRKRECKANQNTTTFEEDGTGEESNEIVYE